jgi:hypothetical protein
MSQPTDAEKPAARRAPAPPVFLALCLGLAACIGPQALDQPLSPMVVRSQLVGRPLVTRENGAWVTLSLAPNGLAARGGPDPEYGRWRTDASGAFCLWWHDQAERCAPVYAAAGAHYRWGDREISVLGR